MSHGDRQERDTLSQSSPLPLLGFKWEHPGAYAPSVPGLSFPHFIALYSTFKDDVAFDRQKMFGGARGDKHRFKCDFTVLIDVVKDNTFFAVMCQINLLFHKVHLKLTNRRPSITLCTWPPSPSCTPHKEVKILLQEV